MKNNIGLVLEGGGMRGMYTAGVLDLFLKENIHLPYVIGVSMGSCNGASYISKQFGRSKKTILDYINDKRYVSYGNLLKTGNLFGMDFLFDEIPNKLIPFDYQTFEESKQRFVIVAADCESGDPTYYEKGICSDINYVLRASCSLPLISKIVEFENKKLLDGGVVDSIPFKRAFEDGNEKLVLILTQPKEYRKKASKVGAVINIAYKKYPKLIEKISNRHNEYNESLEEIHKLEEEGKIFVIRPDSSLNIGRTEKNVKKLQEIYDLGYSQGEKVKESLLRYLES